MRSNPSSFTFGTLLSFMVIVVLSIGTFANAQSRVSTKNSVQAAAIQEAGLNLCDGHYTLTNVATRKSINYHSVMNGLVLTKRAISLHLTHSARQKHWVRVQVGPKNKCISSAWHPSYHMNKAAVAFACKVGPNAEATTLEKTKQWWIMMPVNRLSKVRGHSVKGVNKALEAAQMDSILTRKFGLVKAAPYKRDMSFNNQSLDTIEGSSSDLVRRSRCDLHVGESEKIYMIPTDHLLDQPAKALSGRKWFKVPHMDSIELKQYHEGNKLIQWRLKRIA